MSNTINSNNQNLILVNTGTTNVVISTPSGRFVTVGPAQAITGDWLHKYIGTTPLQVYQQIPSSFVVKGILDPMKEEFIRDNRDASHFQQPEANKRGVAPSPVATQTKAAAAKADGKELDIKRDMGGNPAHPDSSEPVHDGLTKGQWVDRIRSVSDSTLAQNLKVDDIRGVAKLLEIDSYDLLNTKKDLIAAVRVKTDSYRPAKEK